MKKTHRPSRDEIVVRAHELRAADQERSSKMSDLREELEEAFRRSLLADFLDQYGERFGAKGAKAELNYVESESANPRLTVHLTWAKEVLSATVVARVRPGIGTIAARKRRDDFAEDRDRLSKRIHGPFAFYRIAAKAELTKRG